jgi:hypothetical protein
MMPKEKTNAYLNFNLDVFARPMKLIYNDDVSDLSQAKKVLQKFRLVKNDSTIRKNPRGQ